MYRIALRVTGVDLDDDQTFEVIGEQLSHLTWMEVDGRTVVVFHTDKDPVGAASQVARQILCSLAHARVAEVDQDLVGVSDIARRVGVTREAVRLWVEGKRGPGSFPDPVGSSGGGERGSHRQWHRASINDWLRHYNLHDDEEMLTASQVAKVNASLNRVASPIDREWRQVSSGVHSSLRMMPAQSATPCLGSKSRVGRFVPKYAAATAWYEQLSVRAQEKA